MKGREVRRKEGPGWLGGWREEKGNGNGRREGLGKWGGGGGGGGLPTN